jgi:hypothetical protein
LTKKIAIYGSYEAQVPVRQRFWKKRSDGVRQRYWKKTRRTKKEHIKGRYEFNGTGKELSQAVYESNSIVPKGYIDVSARKFLENPLNYGFEGIWLDREVSSR